MMERRKKGRKTVERQDVIVFLAVGAFALLLAACEGGDPASVGACAGATFTAPDPTQPTSTLPISPEDPTFKWTAAEPDTGFGVKHYVVRIYEGSVCSGSLIDTSDERTSTSYSITGNLKAGGVQYAWEVEVTFESTTDPTTTCTEASGCHTFTTS
jgi:hypothetical protein